MGTDDHDIDLKKFDFPSDTLTIKDLRRLYPDRLDTRDIQSFDDPLYDKLSELIFCERGFAAHTYDQARGQKREGGLYGEDLKIVRKELARDYIKFGLASGPAHAQQLVRSIESQAVRQAERHGGKGH